MSDRAGFFDDADFDFDVTGFALQKPKEKIPTEQVRAVAEGAQFPSREPEAKKKRREVRRYRTGRDAQFNIKADPQVIEAFYAIAEKQGWVLGQTLERAVEALQKEVGSGKRKDVNQSGAGG
jgi:hypothetical protein